jgi:hypothetical protein
LANTIANRVYRDKYRKSVLDSFLRRALIAEAICEVDRTDNKRIQNPYGSTPTVTAQALAGTYTIAEYQTTDEALDVTTEIIVAEHIFDFEEILTQFNLFASRTDEMVFQVTSKIDQIVLNTLVGEAGESYTTPAGGFSAANMNQIASELSAKVMGFGDTYRGTYLVLESTDVPGVMQAQMTNGFSFADMALKNGWMTNYGGIDIYVTRPGVFVSATIAGKVFANAGHRVFGVKRTATFASPRGVRFDEKAVSGKTGMEVVAWGYVGAKVWTPKADLTVDITILAS